MTGGFFEQKRASPMSFATVVLLHAGVLGAVVMIKGPQIITHGPPIDLIDIRQPPVPPENPPPPRTEDRQQPTQLDNPVRDIDISTGTGPTVDWPPLPPGPPAGGVTAPPEPPVHVPVRRNPVLDPRFASALQPPYPASEQRAGREGMVRMRVTIGADGRVRAVERISATSEDFWRVAERQALTRWRFRPATLDGRPVEGTKVMTLRFQLEGMA